MSNYNIQQTPSFPKGVWNPQKEVGLLPKLAQEIQNEVLDLENKLNLNQGEDDYDPYFDERG